MALSREQSEGVREALGKRGVPRRCSACGKDKWSLSPELTLLQQLATDKALPLGTGQPCISLHCDNCGNVQVFNVFMLGVAGLFGMNPKSGGG